MALQGLSSYCDWNLSGLRSVHYAPTAWVNTNTYERIISDAWNWQYNIEFTEGDWMLLPVLPGDAAWDETEKASDQGKFFDQQLTGLLRSMRPAVQGEFDEMSNYRFLLQLTDRNGHSWLLGTLESPFDFSAEGSGGQARRGVNGYQVSFVSRTPHRAFGFVPVL